MERNVHSTSHAWRLPRTEADKGTPIHETSSIQNGVVCRVAISGSINPSNTTADIECQDLGVIINGLWSTVQSMRHVEVVFRVEYSGGRQCPTPHPKIKNVPSSIL